MFGKKEFGDVIFDIGVSYYMIGNLSLLINVKNVFFCSVGFADGSKILVTSVGVFLLFDIVLLDNVLYVFVLNCILILVFKLLK